MYSLVLSADTVLPTGPGRHGTAANRLSSLTSRSSMEGCRYAGKADGLPIHFHANSSASTDRATAGWRAATAQGFLHALVPGRSPHLPPPARTRPAPFHLARRYLHRHCLFPRPVVTPGSPAHWPGRMKRCLGCCAGDALIARAGPDLHGALAPCTVAPTHFQHGQCLPKLAQSRRVSGDLPLREGPSSRRISRLRDDVSDASYRAPGRWPPRRTTPVPAGDSAVGEADAGHMLRRTYLTPLSTLPLVWAR